MLLKVTSLAGHQTVVGNYAPSHQEAAKVSVALPLLQVAAVLGQSQTLFSVQHFLTLTPRCQTFQTRSAFVVEFVVMDSVPSQRPAGLLPGCALNPSSRCVSYSGSIQGKEKSRERQKKKKPGRRKPVLTDCWVPPEAVKVGMGWGRRDPNTLFCLQAIM